MHLTDLISKALTQQFKIGDKVRLINASQQELHGDSKSIRSYDIPDLKNSIGIITKISCDGLLQVERIIDKFLLAQRFEKL